MASTLDKAIEHADKPEPAAVIDAAEFEEASRDPRVRDFLIEADRYLIELERAGRSH